MDMDYITRAEHDEFVKRLDAQDRRQDRRIEILESQVKDIAAMTASIEKLATKMDVMATEQAEQGQRLKEIEGRPGRRWDRVAEKAIDTVVGVVIGALAIGLIYLAAQYVV